MQITNVLKAMISRIMGDINPLLKNSRLLLNFKKENGG